MDKQYDLRMLTLIWYLNDVEEGGETEFVDGTLVKPKTGQPLIIILMIMVLGQREECQYQIKNIITSWLYGSQRLAL